MNRRWKQRLERFHQEDDVRFYGLDIVERLEAEGFSVETLSTGSIRRRIFGG